MLVFFIYQRSFSKALLAFFSLSSRFSKWLFDVSSSSRRSRASRFWNKRETVYIRKILILKWKRLNHIRVLKGEIKNGFNLNVTRSSLNFEPCHLLTKSNRQIFQKSRDINWFTLAFEGGEWVIWFWEKELRLIAFYRMKKIQKKFWDCFLRISILRGIEIGSLAMAFIP